MQIVNLLQTGFVETLRPQFTPGQALTSTPINTIEEKLSNLQFQQELENRNQQIKDLTEKLESLKIKRLDDKEKLKDYDKLKIQARIINKQVCKNFHCCCFVFLVGATFGV